MFTILMRLIRVAAAALLLGFWTAPGAEAGWRAETEPTTHTTSGSRSGELRGDPTRGVMMIAVAVALFVFLAWLAVRIGDADHPADKIPN